MMLNIEREMRLVFIGPIRPIGLIRPIHDEGHKGTLNLFKPDCAGRSFAHLDSSR